MWRCVPEGIIDQLIKTDTKFFINVYIHKSIYSFRDISLADAK